MILAEQFLLIALDDEHGTTSAEGVDAALAGALIIDMLRTGALVDEDSKLVARADDPGHALLAEAREAMATGRPRSARRWVDRLPRDLKPLRRRVAEGLVEQGVLTEAPRKVLGVPAGTRYPVADPAPERDLRNRLDSVLVRGAEPTDEESCLIALLVATDLVKRVVPRENRHEAIRRAKDVADHGPTSEAVRKSIQAAQAAVIASVVAATAATSSN